MEKGEKQRGKDWPAVVTQLELLGRAAHEPDRGDCKARFPMKFAGGLPFSLGDLWLLLIVVGFGSELLQICLVSK